MAPTRTSDVFLDQAAQCEGRSELYVELLRAWSDDPVAWELVGRDPSWDAPLRLAAGLHYLVLGGDAAWDDPLDEHRAFLAEFVATQGVQTNEVQRSWVLLPLLLRVAQRMEAGTFDLVELGPSAGLNLVWDRYRYSYEAGEWGRPDAVLDFEGEERRPVPGGLLELEPRVAGRIGIDLSPIDVTTEDGARLLRSFVWAGQEDRMRRLDKAIEAVRAEPPELVRGDYVEELPGVLAARPSGLTIVFQTASFGYIGDEGRARVRSVLEEAGETRRLAFISTGKPRDGEDWGLRIVYWPGGEREFAGHADFHGSWLSWEL
ncbi:MAG TPA: DUF2332 domain-containing protein [Gaiellaceae bacterium]